MLNELFILERRLGIGATAEVYLAKCLTHGESRALKIFTPIVMSDADTVRRIQVEAEALRTLSHPNIVKLFRSHTDSEELALELEFVDGTDLRAWRENYRLNLMEPLLWILRQVAHGLACAHEHGILHRDLKPENILVGRDGTVKLTDFGLARQLDSVTMTKSGLLTGSIGYMAPEILDSQRPSQQSDLFSFGAVAYELFTGKNPFWGPNPQAALKNVLSGKWRPLREQVAGVPPAVMQMIEQCLALDPAHRPKSIWHLEAELMLALRQSPLQKFCKSLVSVEQRPYAMEPAFLEKKKELEIRRASLPENDPEVWLTLAQDWTLAFPDSAEPAAMLTTMPKPAERRGRRKFILIATSLLLLAGAIFYSWPRSQETPPALSGIPAATPALTPSSSPTVAAPRVVTPKNPRLENGWIQVEADSDVRLFIDGDFVPKNQWNKISVRPGKRHVKLVKEGFLPIENLIEVQPKKLAIVKAKGDANE